MAVFVIVFLLKCQKRIIKFLEKTWISFFDEIANKNEEMKVKWIFFI